MKVCLQFPTMFKFVSLECYTREPESTVPFMDEKHSRRAWLGRDHGLHSDLNSMTGLKKNTLCDAG